MKTAIAAFVLGTALLIADLGIAGVVLTQGPPLPGPFDWVPRWWPMMFAFGLLLVNIGTARAAMIEHRRYVTEQLALKATKEVVDVQIHAMHESIKQIAQDVHDIRSRLERSA